MWCKGLNFLNSYNWFLKFKFQIYFGIEALVSNWRSKIFSLQSMIKTSCIALSCSLFDHSLSFMRGVLCTNSLCLCSFLLFPRSMSANVSPFSVSYSHFPASSPLLAVSKLISSNEKRVPHQTWLRLRPAWILLHQPKQTHKAISFFLNQPQNFLMSPACGFAATGNLLCAGVELLPLSWIREKSWWLHNSSSVTPVQDTASWSEELAGVGVIWRCSWNLISSRTMLHKLCKLPLAK